MKTRWVGNVARKAERRGARRKTGHSEEIVVDGRIVLKRIFKKYGGEAWTGLIWLRIGTGRGLL